MHIRIRTHVKNIYDRNHNRQLKHQGILNNPPQWGQINFLLVRRLHRVQIILNVSEELFGITSGLTNYDHVSLSLIRLKSVQETILMTNMSAIARKRR